MRSGVGGLEGEMGSESLEGGAGGPESIRSSGGGGENARAIIENWRSAEEWGEGIGRVVGNGVDEEEDSEMEGMRPSKRSKLGKSGILGRVRRRKLTTLAITKASDLTATQSYALLRARTECLPFAATYYATETSNNKCKWCKKGLQSTPHLIGQCEEFKGLREEVFGSEKVTLASAIHWLEERPLNVIEFIKRANIFDQRTTEALGVSHVMADFEDVVLKRALRRVGEYNRMTDVDMDEFEGELERRVKILEAEEMYR